ncbi:MAG: hypothetical protein E6Y08_18535 [Paenibacillus sp.]|jgi:hypothetical protein|nr:hypothetical protein [Paenibacillus sp.]MDU4697808.1 hypothetical protein [Paenibacillus sp.]
MPNNFIVMGDVDSEEVQQQEAFRRGGSFAAWQSDRKKRKVRKPQH